MKQSCQQNNFWFNYIPILGEISGTLFQCKRHGAAPHDFFISYRVSTNAVLAKELALELNSAVRPGQRKVSAFIDVLCLPLGKVFKGATKIW